MSEFSVSYHLRSDNTNDAVELLKQAGHTGIVCPSKNGWVTFVPLQSDFDPLEEIIQAARSPLVHYTYAEDHQWSFNLFENGKVLSSVSASWDDSDEDFSSMSDLTSMPIESDSSGYHREPLLAFVTSETTEAFENFEASLKPGYKFDFLEDSPAAYLFAEGIGLPYFEYLSPYHLEHSENQIEDCPDAIIVD